MAKGVEYNGWSSYETWAIYTWFNPESSNDVDAIEEQVNEDYDNLPDYMKDLVELDAIDWDELRDHFDDEDDEDSEDE